MWFAQVSSQNDFLTGDLLIKQAEILGTMMQIEKCSYSTCWISRVKQRFKVKRFKIYDESGAFDMQMVRRKEKNFKS